MAVVPVGERRRQRVQGGARRRREEPDGADGLRLGRPRGDVADPTGGVFSLWRGAEGDPPETETTPPGGFIWNELATQDEKMALAFYEKVFGFTHDAMPMPDGTYFVLKQGDKGRAGLYKSMDATMPTQWTPYVCVADCDATADQGEGLGATVVVPPTDIPGVGRLAMFIDPQGASFAILKPEPGDVLTRERGALPRVAPIASSARPLPSRGRP